MARLRVLDDQGNQTPFTNPVIGIHGLMLVGKTELATRLCSHFLPPAAIVPFAKPLKRLAIEMGWDGKKDDRGRRLLQLLGTDCMRECISHDGWVRLWRQEAVSRLHQSEWVIADDLRFANELDAITELGGVVIKVVRPGHSRRHRWWQFWKPRPHASEVELPDEMFHMVFENDGTLEDLDEFAGKLSDLLQHYLRRPSCSSSA